MFVSMSDIVLAGSTEPIFPPNVTSTAKCHGEKYILNTGVKKIFVPPGQVPRVFLLARG